MGYFERGKMIWAKINKPIPWYDTSREEICFLGNIASLEDDSHVAEFRYVGRSSGFEIFYIKLRQLGVNKRMLLDHHGFPKEDFRSQDTFEFEIAEAFYKLVFSDP